MYQEIPAGSIEVQTGLWAYWHTFTVGGTTYGRYILYSAEGYCFYEVNQPENWVDGEVGGELLPLEQRMFATYMSTAYTTVEEINAEVVSVPYEEGYEVVSVGGGHVTA